MASVLVPGPELADAKLSAEERAKASKWVSHQAQSIVRKATLVLMVRAERTLSSSIFFVYWYIYTGWFRLNAQNCFPD